MGGGSSSQQKTNEVNKETVQQLKQQQNNSNPNDLKNNLQNSKLQQNSNINKNILPNPNDKNNKDHNNSSIQKESLNTKINSANQNISHDIPKQNNQTNNSLSNQLKQTLKKLTKSGQSKVAVSILRIAPNSQFPNFKNLQQTQSNYESTWSWKFDERDKKWNFYLLEPQSTGVQFLINQYGQFLKGDQNQWKLLNQTILPNEKIIDKKNYIQQVKDLSFENENDNRTESLQQLQNNKKKLYKAFNQEYVERFAEFPQQKLQKPQQKKKSFKDSYLHFIKKKYQSKSKEWLMTVQILENTDQFSCCMFWRTDLKDKTQLIAQILQEEKKLLQLRKQIYINKMNLFKS